MESLSASATAPREQSLPPKPFLQEHEAVHVTSITVHLERLFPEGSENPQVPLPEHAAPGDDEQMMRECEEQAETARCKVPCACN